MDWETTGGEGLCKKGGNSGLGDYRGRRLVKEGWE